MDDYRKANDWRYWASVWVFPALAIVATVGTGILASSGAIEATLHSRFGALCVISGVWAETYLLQPTYSLRNGWFVPGNAPARKAVRFRFENYLLTATIVLGTFVWGFGDLLV